jgi:mannose-1-phosphate guanylyltransferase
MNLLPYVIVLAGGEGQRLAPLTRALYGTALPKQFAVLAGERSLMQTTVERAMVLTTPSRICVVVTSHHEQVARQQLKPFPGVELVVQPRNLDTGPGLLLPLVRVVARAPTARVIFLPSDHHIADPAPITRALGSTGRGGLRDRIALLGVTPTGPEVEYGWIVRGAPIGQTGGFSVRTFHEKPSQPIADDLWRTGELWNTFISAGPVDVFWALAQRFLPDHAERLERYADSIGSAREREALQHAYDRMTAANFSHAVLANANHLAVVPVTGSGWCDWGSPERVLASLAGTESHTRLIARMTPAGSTLDATSTLPLVPVC